MAVSKSSEPCRTELPWTSVFRLQRRLLIPVLLTGQKRARPELKALVNEAFDTDKEGKYQYRACWHFVAWKLMMNAGSKPCRQSVKLCRSSVAVLISACMNVLWETDEYRPIALDIAGAGV
jgi:hypothetical protein